MPSRPRHHDSLLGRLCRGALPITLETLGADDPEALELLHEYLGPDLTELKTACANAFGVVGKGGNLGSRVWNPNASDSELIACLKDICETMASLIAFAAPHMPACT